MEEVKSQLAEHRNKILRKNNEIEDKIEQQIVKNADLQHKANELTNEANKLYENWILERFENERDLLEHEEFNLHFDTFSYEKITLTPHEIVSSNSEARDEVRELQHKYSVAKSRLTTINRIIQAKQNELDTLRQESATIQQNLLKEQYENELENLQQQRIDAQQRVSKHRQETVEITEEVNQGKVQLSIMQAQVKQAAQHTERELLNLARSILK